ncbi:hypothetical protein MCOR25_010119 [Pyricularia grisea]|nr:hypothetical protein MCOR25_010119 [Pyricularia grisea]
MNSSTPLTSFLRFSVGVSRINVRNESTWARYRPDEARKRFRHKKMDEAGFSETHGEELWVFNHLTTDQIIYSTKPVLDHNRALKQLPFNGKKSKPAKLRKDYWKPMAKIRFPKGEGEVGRSVFQALREFKRRHELEWGYQAESLYNQSRSDRAKDLNRQKANAIADMAAVLGGAGKGNLIQHTIVQVTPGAEKGAEPVTQLKVVPATVFWANKHDPEFAASWPENVKHRLGNLEMTRSEEAELLMEEQQAGEDNGAALKAVEA